MLTVNIYLYENSRVTKSQAGKLTVGFVLSVFIHSLACKLT